MRHDALEELRAENPVPETLAPPPLEPLLARLDEEPPSDRRQPPKPGAGRRRLWAVAPVLVGIAVAVAVAIGAVALLGRAPKPAPASKPTSDTLQHLVDILGVLQRPQTAADREPAVLAGTLAGSHAPRRILALQAARTALMIGKPDVRLARLATITPWGEKVFIEPLTPVTATQAASLKRRYPQFRQAFEQPQPQTVRLALFGTMSISFGQVADIEDGGENTVEGLTTQVAQPPRCANRNRASRNHRVPCTVGVRAVDNVTGILGLDGPSPPLRVVMVIPDGVAKVAFILPRQAYPGAIAYPATQTIAVPVHNNIVAFQTDRYIDQDHWSKIGMIWYAPSGAVVKRIGAFSQLNAVLPDPTLDYTVRTENPSKWDSVVVVPNAGGQSATFTVAFRRPASGAYRYAFRFTGPSPQAGCYSPVGQAAIIRGPDLGIPSTNRGQIASTQFSSQTWCAGTYHVSVALATAIRRPFSTASFTVQP
jgi:hypothetical protein